MSLEKALQQDYGTTIRANNFYKNQVIDHINDQMIEFINAARAELRTQQDLGSMQRDLIRAQGDLVTANNTLAEVNQGLTSSIDTLANKDWNIYIATHNADGSIREEVYQ